jgi:hypothetical protein
MPANYNAAEIVMKYRLERTIEQAREIADTLTCWAEEHHRGWFCQGIAKRGFQGF